MANTELKSTVDDQIDEIFRHAYPNEARFIACNKLIGIAKIFLQKIAGVELDGPDCAAEIGKGFIIENTNTKSKYKIVYYRNYSVNSEERLYIVKNNCESVRLTTYRYSDGRYNAFAEYFDDTPGVTKLKTTNFEENRQHGQRLINETVSLL